MRIGRRRELTVQGRYQRGSAWVALRIAYGRARFSRWIWFLLDSGSELSLLLPKHAQALGVSAQDLSRSGTTLTGLNEAEWKMDCSSVKIRAAVQTSRGAHSFDWMFQVPLARLSNRRKYSVLGRDFAEKFDQIILSERGKKAGILEMKLSDPSRFPLLPLEAGPNQTPKGPKGWIAITALCSGLALASLVPMGLLISRLDFAYQRAVPISFAVAGVFALGVALYSAWDLLTDSVHHVASIVQTHWRGVATTQR